MTSHQVAVAGEAHAASLFARAGCDVLIQYGPNQPDYDLVARRGGISIPVSVKASKEAGWGLIQSYKAGNTYHGAADAWRERQLRDQPDLLFCLICFWGKSLTEAPLTFLATPHEIAEHHKSGKNGNGTTILSLDYTFQKGIGKGQRFRVPEEWSFTDDRVRHFFESLNDKNKRT